MVTRTTRKIVRIDEEKCNGCGQCIISCAEGALAIIDGKAKLVSEKYCDGLGNCLNCPQGAISIEEREADDFDEAAVEKHLERQKELKAACACPGSAVAEFTGRRHVNATAKEPLTSEIESRLGHWPVQLTLVPDPVDSLLVAVALVA